MQRLTSLRVGFTQHLLLALCLVLLVPAVNAQNITQLYVDCSGNDPNAFSNIQQALDSVDWNVAVDVEVRGECHGRVFIGDGTYVRNSVHIYAPVGERASLTPPVAAWNTGTVMTIGGAHGIYIERLDIGHGKNGVIIFDASEVDFNDVTIFDNVNVGVDLQGNTIAYFGASRIQRNGIYGVNVSSQGSNTVYFTGESATTKPSIVEENGQFGVNVGFSGAATFNGNSIVRKNGTNAGAPLRGGIHVARNSAAILQASTAMGPVEVSGNYGPGILAEVSSTVTLSGATIQSNSEQGVNARTRSVLEIQAPGTISGNGIAEVSCDMWSLVTGDLTGLQKLDCKNVDSGKK